MGAGDPNHATDLLMVNYPVLRHFAYEHLSGPLQAVSKPFGELARDLAAGLPQDPETDVALRKLLEAKDAAVRAKIIALEQLEAMRAPRPRTVLEQSTRHGSSPYPK